MATEPFAAQAAGAFWKWPRPEPPPSEVTAGRQFRKCP
jgi:hypothetical protein